MKYPQKKPISVVNTVTGEEIRFESQSDFAEAIQVTRSAINKWNKSNLIRGVWAYKEEISEEIKKHQEFLLTKPQYTPCRKCKIILRYDVVICPLCNTRQ